MGCLWNDCVTHGFAIANLGGEKMPFPPADIALSASRGGALAGEGLVPTMPLGGSIRGAAASVDSAGPERLTRTGASARGR